MTKLQLKTENEKLSRKITRQHDTIESLKTTEKQAKKTINELRDKIRELLSE
ncbi:hypothetical protein LCGC14_0375920 [marine sediment metagenome]|uniref:Uncharacterized protein n=1 Tax=marine sediment metagenome TaxID=412755 RepID=A0A0F9T9N0_9ZZZZ